MARGRFPFVPAFVVFGVCTALGLGIGSALGSRETGPSELVLQPVETSVVSETTAVPLEVPTSIDPSTVDSSLPEDSVPDSAPETTEALPPETTQPPPETTQVPKPPELSLSRGGAFFEPPGNAARFLLNQDDECNSLTVSGSAISCQRFVSRGVAAYWVRDSDGGLSVVVRDTTVEGEDAWAVALETTDSGLSDSPSVADVSGDGEADLIVGWREGDDLAVDVVELVDGQPAVTLHLELPAGSKVRVSGGELLVWRSVGDGQLAQYSVSGGSGAWRSTTSSFVPADSIGPSQF
jgi:hypothetical protein